MEETEKQNGLWPGKRGGSGEVRVERNWADVGHPSPRRFLGLGYNQGLDPGAAEGACVDVCMSMTFYS